MKAFKILRPQSASKLLMHSTALPQEMEQPVTKSVNIHVKGSQNPTQISVNKTRPKKSTKTINRYEDSKTSLRSEFSKLMVTK